jgi:hypothetical protein
MSSTNSNDKSSSYAVAWVDHHGAEVVPFGDEVGQPRRIKAQSHPTGQHGSAVRTEHEFFGHVCDALAGAGKVLVVGPQTGVADFEHYVKKHRAALAPHIVAYKPLARQSENQLVATAREFFFQYELAARSGGEAKGG